MSKDDKQKRIDDYLLNRADDEARREMEEEITRDPGLGAQLADTELALAAIELAEDQALKARLQALETSLAGKAPATTAESTAVVKELPVPGAQKTAMKPRRNLRRFYGIAAAMLVLLVAGWFIMQPRGYDSPGALAMETFEPYANITQGGVRGDADPAATAFAAYDAGRYAEAAVAFAGLPATATNKFYLGQSLLGQQDYAAAAIQFEDVRRADFGLAPEAEYFLALARLGEGKTDLARQLLAAISATADHPSRAEAAELLVKMEQLK